MTTTATDAASVDLRWGIRIPLRQGLHLSATGYFPLGVRPGTGQPESYCYDPRSGDGPEVEAEARADGNSLVDSGLMLALGARQLIYDTAELPMDFEGPRTSRLITTLDPLLYDFHHFTFVSRQIKRGHRLRLVIASVGRLSGSTFIQKNYDGGGVVSEETREQGRPVTVKLFHDAAHRSGLDVPLGRPE